MPTSEQGAPQKGVRILNIRDGFAANSSSSHSLIILRPGEKIVGDNEMHEFGWDIFTLTDPDAKNNYLYYQLRAALSEKVGRVNALSILDKLGVRETRGEEYNGYGYVDHQSLFGLVYDWTGTQVNLEFLTALRDLFAREDFVVLGGNDNGGEHPLFREEGHVPLGRIWGLAVARHDPWANVWTLFSRESGMKVRASFDHEAPRRGGLPELVDVKITDWCDYGCVACYQGSTAKGRHADWRYLERLAESFGSHQVFEVAVGGGEATGHPEFAAFVNALADQKVIPNLTTRNLDYLRNNPEVVERLGALAFSTETADKVKEFASVEIPKGVQRTVQVIDGLVSAEEFRRICESAWENLMSVTLLGFKTTGRGGRWANKLVDSGWVKAYTEDWFRRWNFRIDTALARQYLTEIRELGAEETTFHTEEGAWSCYVDAVAQTMGASSYSPDGRYRPLENPSQLGEEFRLLEVEDGDELSGVSTPVKIVSHLSRSRIR